jgi:transposase
MVNATYDLWVGIDWATEAHDVTVLESGGQVRARRQVQHSGAGIGAFVDWLLELGESGCIAVAIEVPRGALVEMIMERGIAVHAINPKQLDRFRDRHSVAGAKDDSLDSYVLADSLRTDFHLYRRIVLDDPLIIELREFSRMDEELKEELGRLSNRLREQIYRHFPQVLSLCPAADEPWLWDLIELAPTPARARAVQRAQVGRVLRRNRIRRFDSKHVLQTIRSTPVTVAPGTAEAATAHIRLLLPRLRLVQQQIRSTQKRMATLLEQLSAVGESEGQKKEHRDAEIILSVPGIGINVAATMLSEAAQALADRNYHHLRAYSGVAPVTRRSGKTKLVMRRHACNPRLANALYHAARVHSQCDPAAKAHYAVLRQKGHTHGRALRTIGDRLLKVITVMLETRSLYDVERRGRVPPPTTSLQAA